MANFCVEFRGVERCHARLTPVHHRRMTMTPQEQSLAPLTEKQIETFWSHVSKTEECWFWSAAVNRSGYGVVRLNGKNYNAHRISLFILKKINPCIGHMSQDCGHRNCVNPDHFGELSLEHHSKGNRYHHENAIACREPITLGEMNTEPIIFIPLPNGSVSFTNADMLPIIKEELFQISRGYVTRNKSKAHPTLPRRLHRIVCPAPLGSFVDHINGNRLDNRRSNLRVVTKSQNNQNNQKLSSRNRSGKTGVSWEEDAGKWRAQIALNHKARFLGLFSELNQAIKARREAELKYFGEYAPKGDHHLQ